MFDVLTLESCEELFKTVEQEVISCKNGWQDYRRALLKGVYMEGDCLLHLVHQEQSAENLQRSPSSTKSNTEHCVLWKNSPFPRQILPLLRKVLSPAI